MGSLRRREPQESFRLLVASEEHRDILVGHLLKMGAQQHEVMGGQWERNVAVTSLFSADFDQGVDSTLDLF